MKNQFLTSISIGVFSILCTAQAAEYHVNGNSTNPAQDGSERAPFKTIQAAVTKAGHGDTISIAPGIYRESVTISDSKGKEPLIIRGKAQKGARPILTGFRSVTGWTKGKDGLFRATVPFSPAKLLVDGCMQPLSKYPREGWLEMTRTGENTFTAPIQETILPGTTCYIWLSSGHVYGSSLLKAAPKPGSYELDPYMKKDIPGAAYYYRKKSPKEKFFFVNHPCLIREAGDWAFRKSGKGTYEIILKWDKPINQAKVEACGDVHTLDIRNSSNLTIQNLDIMGSADGGISIEAGDTISMSQIGAFWNRFGISFLHSRNISVNDCRLTANHKGLICRFNENVTISKCDIGHNTEDGMNVTDKSKNITIHGNRIHHQLWRGHPDNIQFYRKVRDITVKDNLIFCGMQGIMAEAMDDTVLENNLVVAAGGMLMIMGHDNCVNFKLKHNTFLLGGWGSLLISGRIYDFQNNILDGICFVKEPHVKRQYTGANNLFLSNNPEPWKLSINGTNTTDFNYYLKVSQEKGSQMQQAPVPGMPACLGVISTLHLCTTDTLYLRKQGGRFFQVGDIAEVCMDGVPRQVIARTDDTITIKPAMKYKPAHGYAVLNWKKQKEMKWNPQFIRQTGSTLNFQDLRLDRCTSVPLPKNIRHYIDNIDLLMR